ncbi:MAG: IS110 family transposase [Paracoccaceae bacterium]
MQVTTVGLDLAKNLFQVHGVDVEGNVAVRKKLRRSAVLTFFSELPSCLVGMEACASAHYWARELAALGHEVKLMPPSYVKPYVKRGKNDAVDAEAICEAVRRPTMRFVPVKSVDQQSVLMLHRSRDLLIRQRTMLVNALRGHLAELGIVAARGIGNVPKLIERVLDETDSRIPAIARPVLVLLAEQMQDVDARIKVLEGQLLAWHRTNEASQRLESVPGIGFITATAIAATVTDPSHFKSGRQFAAWIGLVPRQDSTAGKNRLGRISKMGDRYLRRLLVVGATALIRFARNRSTPLTAWADALLEQRSARLVSVALANKMARIAWAILARGETYRTSATVAV